MYNYILVIGQKEIDNNNINVRYRDKENYSKCLTISELLGELKFFNV